MPRDAALDRIHWVTSIPFLAVHAVALATPFLVPVEGRWIALAAGTYLLRMFAITAGYHRYFSHRAYRTGRTFQLVLAFLGASSAQKGPLWWAANHRNHHRHSDGPEDVHSPVRRGFWWSHVGWILARRYEATRLDRVQDLARFPELRWLDRWHFVAPISLAAVLLVAGGWGALLWGFFVSTVFLWHATFLVNSLAHVVGRRRYLTGDASRNGLLLSLLTMGEGWHNNHHFYPTTANQGWFWWEVDASYAILRGLAALRIVSGLRVPPEHVRMAHLSPAAAGPGRPIRTHPAWRLPAGPGPG
jgi:stearoyl-CoA desaturase (delta-9 desaturase)